MNSVFIWWNLDTPQMSIVNATTTNSYHWSNASFILRLELYSLLRLELYSLHELICDLCNEYFVQIDEEITA